MLIRKIKRKEFHILESYSTFGTYDFACPFSKSTYMRIMRAATPRHPPEINQPRKICRKVLTSRRGAAFRVRERVKPAPLSRVPETPRGPRGDFLVLRLILPDADVSNCPALQSCWLYDAGSRCGTTKKENRGDWTRGTVGPYRRSCMTRQANCVISVQRTPPRLRRRSSSCRPFAARSS